MLISMRNSIWVHPLLTTTTTNLHRFHQHQHLPKSSIHLSQPFSRIISHSKGLNHWIPSQQHNSACKHSSLVGWMTQISCDFSIKSDLRDNSKSNATRTNAEIGLEKSPTIAVSVLLIRVSAWKEGSFRRKIHRILNRMVLRSLHIRQITTLRIVISVILPSKTIILTHAI